MNQLTYINLDALDKDNFVITSDKEVYITMSTIPARLKNTFVLIKHFLAHVTGFKKLILNVPFSYRRWPYLNITIPENIEDERFLLNRCEDFGPMTKFYPTLDIVPDDAILIIRDDMCYKLDAFVDIVSMQDIYLNQAFSYYVYDYNGIKVPQGADLISAHMSSLKGFKEWLQDFMKSNNLKDYYDTSCFFVDDQVIGWYFSVKGIPMNQVENKHRYIYVKNCEFSDESQNLNQLKGNNSRDNTMLNCYIDMSKAFKI